MMVHGEWSRDNPFAADIRAITDAQGHYRLVGLPLGREGHILAVPPCDFAVSRSVKAELKIPADQELPYLRTRVAVEERRGTESLHLDIETSAGFGSPPRSLTRPRESQSMPDLSISSTTIMLTSKPFKLLRGRTQGYLPASSGRTARSISLRFQDLA